MTILLSSAGAVHCTARRMRCTCMSPSSSPLYAFAMLLAFANYPIIRLRPFEYSIINALAHNSRCNCFMYDPSVTVMHKPSSIASLIQSSLPTILRFSQIQQHPQLCSTSQILSSHRAWFATGVCKIAITAELPLLLWNSLLVQLRVHPSKIATSSSSYQH